MTYSLRTIHLVLAFTAVTPAISQDRISGLQAKGDQAYRSLRYSDAVDAYKSAHRAVSGKGGSSDAVVQLASKVADGYWMLRRYDSAYRWYATLPADRVRADEKLRVRMSDLLSIRGMSDQAADMLSGIPGYEDKMRGFRDSKRVGQSSRDWKLAAVGALAHPNYRDFSPFIIDGGLAWTTNRPMGASQSGIMGWDNMSYSRLVYVQDPSTLSASVQVSGKQGASGSASRVPARIAATHTLADLNLPQPPIRMPGGSGIALLSEGVRPLAPAGDVRYNMAHASYDAAGKKIYYTLNEQGKVAEGTVPLSVVVSDYSDGSLQTPTVLFAGDKDQSCVHPAIHPNGKSIVFASNRSGSKGGYDLYRAVLGADGKWSEPKPLASLNTRGNELFPTFGADGMLFFCSDGMSGIGCLDVYRSQMNGETASSPEHLPAPVNSPYDDFGMTVGADGKKGYLSSDRNGSDDIFSFVFEKVRMDISGELRDEQGGNAMAGVRMELKTKRPDGTMETVARAESNANGAFSITADADKDYELHLLADVEQKVYKVERPSSGTKKTLGSIRIKKSVQQERKVTAPVVEKPQVQAFNPIRITLLFDFDSYELSASHEEELRKVVEAMQREQGARCSVEGHTDAFGSSSYNMALSGCRVASVKKYLESNGISTDRITTQAYGASRLKATNVDKEGGRVNRRVEVEVVKI